MLFVFNFHHSKSYENYRIGTQWSSDHIFLFDTDSKDVGGHGRLNSGYEKRFVPQKGNWQSRPYSMSLYLPSRTAVVLLAEENMTEEVRAQGVEMPPIETKQKFDYETLVPDAKI